MRISFTILIAITLTLCWAASSQAQFEPHAQTEVRDTQTKDYSRSDSAVSAFKPGVGTLAYQFVAGQAAFALPFWTIGGAAQLDGKENSPIGGVLLAYVTVPLGVWGATALYHENRGSFGLAFVGSLLSIALSAFLIPNSPTRLERYLFTAVPLVITTELAYDLPMWLKQE